MVSFNVGIKIFKYRNSMLLLNHQANVNQVNNKGKSALMYVINYLNSNNNIDIVKLMLDRGVNVNQVSNDGWSVLMYAQHTYIKNNNSETIKLLLESNANINIRKNNKSFYSFIDLLNENDRSICLTIIN